MKKFLFTLVALMSVGSALAINTIIIPDQELTEAQLGTTVTVACPAQFDNYVSAWRIQFESVPEGVTVTNLRWGKASSTNMTMYNSDGDQETYRPQVLGEFPTWLAASMAYAYDEDGNYMGTPHWIGNLDTYLRIDFVIDANFKGGTIEYWVEPSAGGGPAYPANECCPSGSHHDMSCTFTVPAGPVEPTPAPVPVIGLDDNGDVIATAEGHTVQLYLNGEPVEQPYELPEASYDQAYHLVFTATTQPNENETATSTPEGEEYVVDIAQLQPTAAPAPVISLDDNGDVIATAEGHTVQLYLNGNPVDQPYELPAATWETQVLSFTAVTQPGEHETATESAEPFVVTIDPLQPQPATAPEIVVENGFVTAVAEGHQTVLMLDGQVVNQPYELPAAGEEDVTLHFSAYTIGGEHETNSATVTKDVVVEGTGPVNPLPVCERPECAYSITALETVTVTITNNEPGATVYWSYVDPVTGETVEGSFTGEQDQIIVDGVGQYTITCYAAMTGYQNSPDGGCFFTILPNDAPPTAIDELVNGKTVAGVRYFNMAGQEMQEANGMTIVVTTYTDGTTSAVKVMK